MDVDRQYTAAECLVAHTDAIRWLIDMGAREAALILSRVRVASITDSIHPWTETPIRTIEVHGTPDALAQFRPLTTVTELVRFEPGGVEIDGAAVAGFGHQEDVPELVFELVVDPDRDVARNQGTLYPGPGKVEYGGLRFRSRTETRIAQVLDDMNVLYFPLPVAVRHHNHSEPDFVIVHLGHVGVLEVDGPTHTPTTRAKEDVRADWFDLSGVLVRHYDVKDIDRDPEGVVKRFLRGLRGPVL